MTMSLSKSMPMTGIGNNGHVKLTRVTFMPSVKY